MSPTLALSRSFRVAFAALIGLALAFPFVGSITPASAAGAYTTSALNLRAGPSTNNYIKLTMPEGSWVELLSGLGRAGFYKVSYDGELGYAYGDYLSVGGGGGGSDPGWDDAGTAYTTSALNLRSGPSLGHSVHLVMPYGVAVQLTGAADSGFSGIVYGSQNGWASNEYLTDGDGGGTDPGSGNAGTAYVTSSLNLRSGPGIGNSVILVMPQGAEVTLTGEEEAGFAGVRYDGTSGWASLDYLSDTPVDDSGSDGVYTQDEIIQIVYAAADRYGQSRAAMLQVARCESVLDPYALNPYSSASGLFQFLPGTWATTPFANQDIMDPVANANAAGWMWSVGRRGEWVC